MLELTHRSQFSDSLVLQRNLNNQNPPQNLRNQTSAFVKTEDYVLFTPLMSRRSKISKVFQVYCSNLKRDFSDYFKASFLVPLASISGTIMAAGSSIYLGMLSGGWRPKLFIPTLLATQVVVPHGIVGGLALGTTVITAGIFIKSLVCTVKTIRMSPADRLLASYRNTLKALESLTEQEFLTGKPLSVADEQRKTHLENFLEKRKAACQSILASRNASRNEYRLLKLDTVQSSQEHLESVSPRTYETTL